MRSEVGLLAPAFFLKADPWLSGILDRPAWRVDCNSADREPLSKLNVLKPVFAYSKLGVGQIAEVSALADAGFRVVDVALTFDGVITGTPGDAGDTRFAAIQDREAVSGIAGSAFRYSRFHLDPLVPKHLADAIKSAWAANYFDGKRGDGMIVAERNGDVVGFLQLLWTAQNDLVIDLIGVDSRWQGKGIGKALIRHAATQGTGDGRLPTRMIVGTQAANTPSVRLYESLGFRLRAAQYVMHYHGMEASQK